MSVCAFRPRARLLLQLGDQLIRNEGVALLELVKNGYDAGSEVVEIEMSGVQDVATGRIVVTDHGCGMSAKTIRQVWMEPGTDFQLRNLTSIEEQEAGNGSDGARGGVKLARKKRKPLGEKGIGRFAAHKLGDRVELVTRASGTPEVRVELDWAIIAATDYLDQLDVDVETRKRPEVFTGTQTGTRITIHRIRKPWGKSEIRQLYRSVLAMCSPFRKPDDFRIDFKIDDPDVLKGLPKLEEMLEEALYSFDCTVKGDRVEAFRYTFQPFTGMTRVRAREVRHPLPPTDVTTAQRAGEPIPTRDRHLEKALRLVWPVEPGAKEEPVPLDLSKVGVGSVRFQGYIFDRDAKVLEFAHLESKTLSDYMKSNGGVRVYRDGVRVYDYGEPGNDWLNLQGRRVNRPGVKLDNNLLLATVELDRSSSRALIEKTNREGFIENESFDTLVEVVIQCLGLVENYRHEDKDRIRLIYGVSNRKERTPLLSRIEEARGLIEQKVTDPTARRDLGDALARVEEDYQFVTKTLLTSAGAGMQLSLAVHEIEKVADELVRVTARGQMPVRVRELVERLKHLIERYKTMLKRGTKKRLDLSALIRSVLFQAGLRFETHGIEPVNRIPRSGAGTWIEGIENLLYMGVHNLIDNSIYWLEYAGVEKKRMFFDLRESPDGGQSLIVADNGTGFNLPSDLLIRPFLSKRPEGSGLGLYLLDEIMVMHGGTLTFPEAVTLNLPTDFEQGAVASMNFPDPANARE